jgi:group I intron endonuclease
MRLIQEVVQCVRALVRCRCQAQLKQNGIYVIRHIETGRVYIGSARGTFRTRWYNHRYRLRHNKHHCKFLQAAWNKYGEQAFEFEIIEVANDGILELEQKYLDAAFNSPDKCFNGSRTSTHPCNFTVSEETRAKISAHFKGRPKSQEQRERTSRALKGRKRPDIAQMQRERFKNGLPNPELRKARLKEKISVPVRRLDNGEVFPSKVDAAHALNLSVSSIGQALVKGCRAGGTYWERV